MSHYKILCRVKVEVRFPISACEPPVFLASFVEEAVHSPLYLFGITENKLIGCRWFGLILGFVFSLPIYVYVLMPIQYCLSLNESVTYLDFSMLISSVLLIFLKTFCSFWLFGVIMFHVNICVKNIILTVILQLLSYKYYCLRIFLKKKLLNNKSWGSSLGENSFPTLSCH